MELEQVMAALQAAGTEQNRKVYQRHGARPPLFGVSFTEQRKLAKRLAKRQELAEALWATNNADARYLATAVADPEAITKSTLRRWAKGLDHYVIVELVAKNVASKSPLAWELVLDWTQAKGEWIASLGWATLANLAMSDDGRPAREYEAFLSRIEAEIHGAPNRVRHEMNGALIAIGTRSEGLAKKATMSAKRIGPIEVGHGHTSCKTPDAASHIAKARAHRAAKSRSS